jgi:hypothetical protein
MEAVRSTSTVVRRAARSLMASAVCRGLPRWREYTVKAPSRSWVEETIGTIQQAEKPSDTAVASTGRSAAGPSPRARSSSTQGALGSRG